MARISVIGSGYVGLCTGVAFAKHGHDVTLVDIDPAKVALVKNAKPPFFEPGLAEALKETVASGRLAATTDLAAAVKGSDFTFLAVGTPQDKSGAMDLTYIRQAAKQVGAALRGKSNHVVVTKSTVLPGTAETVVAKELEAGLSGPLSARGVAVASNPEFLKEGAAMKDALHPDRIVVGADAATAKRIWELYKGFDCPKVTVTPRTAEMIKYAANAFLAVKITASNELANLCEKVGVDWNDVANGIGLDARINPLFLRAGIGYGGSCFPKDIAAVRDLARREGSPTLVLDAVSATNETQPLRAVELLRGLVGDLKGKRIALLGLAFKPDTDDVRQTRSLPILHALRGAGADVVCHDPEAKETFLRLAPDAHIAATAEEALKGADGCIVATEWAQYRTLDPAKVKSMMRTPNVVDGRRALDAAKYRAAGFAYRAIGLGL